MNHVIRCYRCIDDIEEGYCVRSGPELQWFCSKKCLHEVYSDELYRKFELSGDAFHAKLIKEDE